MTAAHKEPHEATAEPRLSLVRRATSLTILDAIGKGLAFLAAVVIAREGGPAVLGALSYAQAIATYALIAANCGLELCAVRTFATGKVPLPRLVPTVVRLRLATGTVSFVGLVAITLLFDGLRSQLMVVFLYGLSVFSLAVSLNWVSQAVRKTHVMGFAIAGAQAIYLGLVLLLATPETAAWFVPGALVVGEFTVAALVYRWVRKEVGALAAPLSAREGLALLRGAVPIGMAQILRATALGSDLVVVGSLLSFVAAGHYAAAYKLYTFGISSVNLYVTALFPRIAHLAHARSAGLSRELLSSIGVVMAIGVPLLAVTGWFAAHVLALLFGAEFSDAASALRIMLATLLVFAVTAHLRSSLIGMNRQQLDAITAGVVGLIHVGAKIVLGARYGMEGVALGGLIGESAYLLLCLAAYRRYADPAPAELSAEP